MCMTWPREGGSGERKSIEIARYLRSSGALMRPMVRCVRPSPNWPALNEPDAADPTIRTFADLRNVRYERMNLEIIIKNIVRTLC